MTGAAATTDAVVYFYDITGISYGTGRTDIQTFAAAGFLGAAMSASIRVIVHVDWFFELTDQV